MYIDMCICIYLSRATFLLLSQIELASKIFVAGTKGDTVITYFWEYYN